MPRIYKNECQYFLNELEKKFCLIFQVGWQRCRTETSNGQFISKCFANLYSMKETCLLCLHITCMLHYRKENKFKNKILKKYLKLFKR